jgi:hypothetical protein
MSVIAQAATDTEIVFLPRPQRFRLNGRVVDGWLDDYDDEPGEHFGRRYFAIVVLQLGGTGYRIPVKDLID